MKKFMLLVLFVLACITLHAQYSMPYAYHVPTNEVPWWLAAHGKEKFALVNHKGETNTTIRKVGLTSNFTIGGGNGTARALVTPDCKILKYTIPGVNIERGWSTNNICPGTYDLQNGKFYIELTGEEKLAMWIAYTNQVIQAALAEEAAAKAPAKFDVSMTPDEFKAQLLGDRVMEDLLPAERRDINSQVSVYRREWIRINDPEKYDREYRGRLLMPNMRDIRTEQQKIKSRRVWRRR